MALMQVLSVMGSDQENIVVMCQHSGVLLNYSAMLNCLGYFKVVLCSNMKDVRRALGNLRSVDIFLLDDFKVGSVDVQHLIDINCGGRVKRFLLVGDFTFDDHFRVFAWAKAHHISLLGMIRHPVRAHEILDYLTSS
ncbi:hypothetical protein [Pseudomonas sp. S35]|uniref:hypothetical protein n=1 Tax=Pseudomonas sp. S35 TaxID=1573719 RepID=UPI00135C6D89|nr:hypothetical protein [Pseudomonas sp. S35]